MIGLIWWLLIGLIAGALARFLVPGPHPMSWLMTMVLGLVGSVVGGLISALVFNTDLWNPEIHVGGLLMSIVGAVIVLALYVGYVRPRWGS